MGMLRCALRTQVQNVQPDSNEAIIVLDCDCMWNNAHKFIGY